MRAGAGMVVRGGAGMVVSRIGEGWSWEGSEGVELGW